MSDETEKELALLLKRKRLFEELIETPAWKELLAIGSAQIDGQISSLLEAPRDEIDGALWSLKSEYRKGVIYGIKVILGTPTATIFTARELNSDRQPRSYTSDDRTSSTSEQRQLDLLDTDRVGPDTHVTDLSGE